MGMLHTRVSDEAAPAGQILHLTILRMEDHGNETEASVRRSNFEPISTTWVNP